MHAESGQIPPQSLAYAVHDRSEVHDGACREPTGPLSTTESLQRPGERIDEMSTQAAGSSALVEAKS
jgi:hypothetical protein